MAEREPGFYRVTLKAGSDNSEAGEWIVAQWVPGRGYSNRHWWITGWECPVGDDEISEIGERVDPQPQIYHEPAAPPPRFAIETLDVSESETFHNVELPPWRWPDPQLITDAQKTGDRFLVWSDDQWMIGEWIDTLGYWDVGDGSFPKNLILYLPLPPDVK